MLHIRLKELCALRGIREPYGWLVQNGMPVVAARKFSAGTYKHIPLQHLERLCLLLRCAPNDLFTWEPPAGMNTSNHPLAALLPQDNSDLDWIAGINSLNFEELRAIGRKLKEDNSQKP